MQQHEKTSLRYVFFRLYSNDELLDFLKEQLKNGLVLDHCKGNFFFFRRWQLQNARLCVISIPCSKPRVEDDDEVQEYLDIAKRKGWQLLCVGDYESLLPMRLWSRTRLPIFRTPTGPITPRSARVSRGCCWRLWALWRRFLSCWQMDLISRCRFWTRRCLFLPARP